jgi:hypothetical protein
MIEISRTLLRHGRRLHALRSTGGGGHLIHATAASSNKHAGIPLKAVGASGGRHPLKSRPSTNEFQRMVYLVYGTVAAAAVGWTILVLNFYGK